MPQVENLIKDVRSVVKHQYLIIPVVERSLQIHQDDFYLCIIKVSYNAKKTKKNEDVINPNISSSIKKISSALERKSYFSSTTI